MLQETLAELRAKQEEWKGRQADAPQAELANPEALQSSAVVEAGLEAELEARDKELDPLLVRTM